MEPVKCSYAELVLKDGTRIIINEAHSMTMVSLPLGDGLWFRDNWKQPEPAPERVTEVPGFRKGKKPPEGYKRKVEEKPLAPGELRFGAKRRQRRSIDNGQLRFSKRGR